MIWTPVIHWIIEKAREFKRKLYFIDYNTDWLYGSQETVENSYAIQRMQVKKQQLGLDTEQWTGSKLWKEYVKAVYCHPTYLTYVQSTSWEMLVWVTYSWNQDCQEKYQ